MFILKKGHQPGVYVPLRALFLVSLCNSQWLMYIHKQNFLHNLKSLIEFHQTLHTHSYLYDKYLLLKGKG